MKCYISQFIIIIIIQLKNNLIIFYDVQKKQQLTKFIHADFSREEIHTIIHKLDEQLNIAGTQVLWMARIMHRINKKINKECALILKLKIATNKSVRH